MSAPAPPPMLMATDFAAVPLLRIVSVQQGEHGSEEEEHDVHDAQGEAGLEHGARLVDADGKAVDVGVAEDAEAHIVGAARGDVAAVGAVDEAEVVDTGYQGAEKAEVNQPDEARVGAAAVVAEQREDGPRRAKHRDDEQDQDVGGRQEVV